MRKILRKLARCRINSVAPQGGFGIIEALIVLLLISAVAAGLSQYFLSSKDMVINQQVRLAFEEDLLRLMMITEENSICEKLNFVDANIKIGGAQQPLGTLTTLAFDKVPLLKTGKDKSKAGREARYTIDKIELLQLSRVYGVNPIRARGSIRIYPKFWKKDGSENTGSKLPKLGMIDVIIAADPSGEITSCYGTFSRKISCLDGNGTFNPEVAPNCDYK